MSLGYLPAELKILPTVWYIEFYQTHPVSKKKVRFRKTFSLNRIKDKSERKRKAALHILDINAKLPLGFPFIDEYNEAPKHTNIVAALDLAKSIKIEDARKKTAANLKSMHSIFMEFLHKKKWDGMHVSDFQKHHALEFLDYGLIKRKIGPITYNNYIGRMYTLFEALVIRKYCDENPFAGHKKKKSPGKKRRAFSNDERSTMAKYINENDRWLMLGILLQYHCFIRPVELRRLRFSMIDLNDGVIRMPGEVTKNKQNAIVTIPYSIIPTLKEYKFKSYPQNHLIYGVGIKPHPTDSCGHNTLNLRHKKILMKLKSKGKLFDINGLSFYSWKDTGAIELFKAKVNILEIMRQLRHTDLSTTQKYCNSLYTVNKEIQVLDNSIF